MKKLMSLGCLMALVLAGAPAFAADWFTGDFTSPVGGAWGAFPTSWAVSEQGVASFNDWERGAVFEATTEASTSLSNSIVKTSVMFTPLDGSEKIPTDEMVTALKDAKAGLTIVEDKDENKAFWGIVGGQWTKLQGSTESALGAAVPVKIEIMRGTDGSYVQYSVGEVVLTTNNNVGVFAADTQDIEVKSVSYLGNVPALSQLVGFAYGNTTEAKEEIAVTETETIPAKIAYNPADLAVRNIDLTNPDEIKSYLTGTQSNGNLGWVNSTLGIADDQFVEIASNTCAKGSVTVDFGFASDDNSTIEYVIDTANTNGNAAISTAESGIHTVAVQVTQGGKTVTVTNQQVGVMNTGKTVTEEQMKEKAKVFDIVAVPFESFQGEVTVANVLNTAELTNGDTLYVLNGNKYDTYVLDGTVWKVASDVVYTRGQTAVAETLDPEEKILTPGQAIWIERDANSKIVFAGKGEVSENHVWTWKPEYGEYSLVANPTINSFELKGRTFGKDGDQIIVEDVANPRKFERRDGVWGEWVSVTKQVRGKDVTTLSFDDSKPMVIGAGIGFWYYNPARANVEIDFGTNVRSEQTVD